MAIFVSNPSTVSFAGVSTEPVDPALVLPEAGFTEELALAMRPRSPGSEAGPEAAERSADDPDETLADLQILPPDVLLHAVGDANFALAALNVTAKPAVEEPFTDANSVQLPGAATFLAGVDQSAALALADAQLSSSGALSSPENPNALAQAAVMQSDRNASVSGAVPTLGLAASMDSSSALVPEQNLGLAAEAAQALPGNSSPLMPSPTSPSERGLSQVLTAVASGLPTPTAATVQTAGSAPDSLAPVVGRVLTEVLGQAVSEDVGLVADRTQRPDVPQTVALPSANLEGEVVASVGQAVLPNTDPRGSNEALTLTAGEQSKGIPLAVLPQDVQTSKISLASSLPDSPSATNPAVQAGRVSAQIPVSATVAQVLAPAQSNVDEPSPSVVVAPTLMGVTALPADGVVSTKLESGGAIDKNRESALNFDAKLGMQTPAEAPMPVAVVMPDMVSARDQSFDEVSSTFVSSLVGGPQRPVTTVMDWVALQPQERPAPVEPHEVRLDGGAVQVEIQRLVKQGGGHIVMELTPPDQSKFTIELKLDDHGGAFLLVEGVSDSTRTRLEQSASQLHEQFQQMGLNLQLDMRQHRESASSGSTERPEADGGAGNQPPGLSVAESRAAASARAREAGGSQIYLYA
jgi:hypothetical protein